MHIGPADPVTDGHAFLVAGLEDYDAKGASRRTYLPWFWDGDPRAYPLGQGATTLSSSRRYDAFGRDLQGFGLDGSLVLQSVYHALSVDEWDAADLAPGPHAGAFATARKDGHGRSVSTIERAHVSGKIEARETRTDYLPTGEAYRITRTRGAGDDVVRWLRYDSLGRMVLNAEPNTTKGFTADVNADPRSFKAWRYAYDDAGDVVGTSDARGCGVNYEYDYGGRVVVEDYSPCTAAQVPYSSPVLETGFGAEVYYHYDAIPAGLSGESAVLSPGADGSSAVADYVFDACAIDPSLQNGRLTAVSDRGARTVTGVDGRGRATCVARQVARPDATGDSLEDRYAPAWFSQVVTYDGADRPVVDATTGAKALLDPVTAASVVHTDYTPRGTLRRVTSSYGAQDASSWPDLVTSVTHDADGAVSQIVYGDTAHTTTATSHDGRRRLSSVQTYRGAPAVWTADPAPYAPAPELDPANPTTFQLLLEDTDYGYDAVDNPISIQDWRNPAEWPAGAKPVTRKMQYDDLNRLSRVDYSYSTGDDAWVDPFALEDGGEGDPRRAKPSPHLSFAKRPLWQTYAYDWLGNTTHTDDDAGGFYDRSIGAIVNGSPAAQPYQLKGASGGAAPRDGAVSTAYDDAGNLVGMSIARNGGAPCLPDTTACSQRFAYEWDEAGRMVRARRWDGAGLGVVTDPVPTASAAADLTYAYDDHDARVRKTATDADGNTNHSLYVFESVEIRGALFDGTDFEDTPGTEVPYLFANGERLARVHYAPSDVPTWTSGRVHVLLELQDQLGSASLVIDRSTSELVEASTYQPYGATESDYRPARWDGFREDHRFTGKEEDVEVGLAYFSVGAFLAPALGRWVNPDPLALHTLDADLNLFAYVHGRVLIATDPDGLAEDEGAKMSVPDAPQAPATEDGPMSVSPSDGGEANMTQGPLPTPKQIKTAVFTTNEAPGQCEGAPTCYAPPGSHLTAIDKPTNGGYHLKAFKNGGHCPPAGCYAMATDLATSEPVIAASGYYVAKTSYTYAGFTKPKGFSDPTDPKAYVDGSRIPELSIGGDFMTEHKIKYGDFALAYDDKTKRMTALLVVDNSGAAKNKGEMSIVAESRLLGEKLDSPTTIRHPITIIVFPGTHTTPKLADDAAAERFIDQSLRRIAPLLQSRTPGGQTLFGH